MRTIIGILVVGLALTAAAATSLFSNTDSASAADLDASWECQGNDLLVTVSAGDGTYTVDVDSNPATIVTTYIGFPEGNFLFAYNGDDDAMRFTSVTVTETSGDNEVLELADPDIVCGAVDIVATWQCQGNDLLVTVSAGDGTYTVDVDSNPATVTTTYIGFPEGDFLFAYDGDADPMRFTSVTVTETGTRSDQETVQLADPDIVCGAVDVVATWQCQGNDLIVTVHAGDQPYTVHAQSNPMTTVVTYIGFPEGNFLFANNTDAGPTKFTVVRVTETNPRSDNEVLDLASVDQPIVCGAVDLLATWQCQGTDLLVTIHQGDGQYDIASAWTSPPSPTVNASILVNGIASTYLLQGDDDGRATRFISIEVEESGVRSDNEVLELATPDAPIVCFPLAAEYQCQGNDLLVSVEPGLISYEVSGVATPALVSSTLTGAGNQTEFLLENAGPLATRFSSVMVTELAGGDGESIELLDEDVVCGGEKLEASAQCQGADLVVTVMGGDPLYTVTARSGSLVKSYTTDVTGPVFVPISGAATWSVSVRETEGDRETLSLGEFSCQVTGGSAPASTPTRTATPNPTTPTQPPASTPTPAPSTPVATATPTDTGAVGDTGVKPTPRPPATGSGSAFESNSGVLGLLAILGIAVALSGAGLVLAARRR